MHGSNVEDGKIRKLWPTQIDEFQEHLMRLDRESKQMRFCGAVGDAFIERYCETIRRVPTIIHGFFVDGKLRAAGELRPILNDYPVAAEAAFTVETPWQDSGVGTELMDRVLLSARNRNIATLYMICMAENRRMRGIARKFEANLRFDRGEVAATVDPSTPDYFSLLREGLNDSTGFVTAIMENNRKVYR